MTSRKSFIPLLLCVFILNGCCPNASDTGNQDAVVKINDYIVTREEFEKEFKDSAFGKIDTAESRQDFLNSLIDRKLILQYAQREGLDRGKSFLKMIERFWEQSLLKIAIDKKTNEIEGKASVTDDEIKKAYDDMLRQGKIAGPYESAYKRIKWDLVRAKETKLMSDWMSEIHKKAQITVNLGILKKENR